VPKKFSEIMDEQVQKTEAILRYVVKKPIDDSNIYMYLVRALNSLKVVHFVSQKLEGDKGPWEPYVVDEAAAFAQMKDFFREINAACPKPKK